MIFEDPPSLLRLGWLLHFQGRAAALERQSWTQRSVLHFTVVCYCCKVGLVDDMMMLGKLEADPRQPLLQPRVFGIWPIVTISLYTASAKISLALPSFANWLCGFPPLRSCPTENSARQKAERLLSVATLGTPKSPKFNKHSYGKINMFLNGSSINGPFIFHRYVTILGDYCNLIEDDSTEFKHGYINFIFDPQALLEDTVPIGQCSVNAGACSHGLSRCLGEGRKRTKIHPEKMMDEL